jgi:dTDP-4-amino-4,6-dideoxygalactose transaminase
MNLPTSFTTDPATVSDRPRIPLSVPHLTGDEMEALGQAVASNWLGPIGPEVASFEEEFAGALDVPHALATTSGTAALHLALRVLGIGPGDEVLVSTFTFCASVNPIIYLGARPVFVDSETESWNLDPAILAEELDRRGRSGRLPAAVIAVHLFGQTADMSPILEACDRWDVPIVEDAAEALGATGRDPSGAERPAGRLGRIGIFSFDASKIITTSMGGMLISEEHSLVAHARKLARQAREPAPHYEHLELGYNYRMSNLLAAVGRVQLRVLPERVAARQQVFRWYQERLSGIPGLDLQPEAPWGRHARWLTCITLDEGSRGPSREELRIALADEGIETRPVWKPLHLQPVYRDMGIPVLGGSVSESLFDRGLCLPSSSSLTEDQVARVCDVIGRTIGEWGVASGSTVGGAPEQR